MSDYVPVWSRPENPTSGLSDIEARAYWKRTDVEHSLRFYLAIESIPEDLKAVYRAMLADLETTGRKAKPEDKALIQTTRYAWGRDMDGLPYVVPQIPAYAAPARKPAKVHPDMAAMRDALIAIARDQPRSGDYAMPRYAQGVLDSLGIEWVDRSTVAA